MHADYANVIIERVAFGKLTDLTEDALEEFLRRQHRVATYHPMKVFLSE